MRSSFCGELASLALFSAGLLAFGQGAQLPVAGGTITGTLNGTSANFTGTVSASNLPVPLTGPPFNAKCDGVADDSAALAAAGSSGKSILIPGTCNFSKPFTVTSPVMWYGLSSAKSVLHFTSTTGTAVTWNPSSPGTANGLQDVSLVGSGGTSTGILLGGSNGATQFAMSRSVVDAFGYGMIAANNTWLVLVEKSSFNGNSISSFYYPDKLNNSGESIVFTDSLFNGSSKGFKAKCVDIEGSATEVVFRGGSFDDGCQLYLTKAAARVIADGVHFETGGATMTDAMIKMEFGGKGVWTPSLEVLNSTFVADTAPTAVAMISADQGQVNVRSVEYWNNTTGRIPILALSGTGSGRVEDVTLTDGTNPTSIIANTGTGQNFQDENKLMVKFIPSAATDWYTIYIGTSPQSGGMFRISRPYSRTDLSAVDDEYQFWIGAYTSGATISLLRHGVYSGKSLIDQARAWTNSSGNQFLDIHTNGIDTTQPITVSWFGQSGMTPVNNPVAGATVSGTLQTTLIAGTGTHVGLDTTGSISGASVVGSSGVGPASNVLWNSGAGVPSAHCGVGSLYSNTSATSASTVLYVCYPANTWTAIAVP